MLAIEGVQASYSGSLVLQGVDLEVPRGRIMALMGRNGMGKTTLLKSIMGLLPVRKGSILFQGEPIQKLPAHTIARRGIGYVPQGREIFSDFTVEGNLRLGLLSFPRGKRKPPEDIFRYFPVLAERRQQKAGSLSGGQQQMLAIARALASRPRLLLLDEPSEGIQPSIVEEITAILRRLNQETGLTVLIVEQNVNMITELAHACCFMAKGRLVQTCSIDEILADESIITRHMGV